MCRRKSCLVIAGPHTAYDTKPHTQHITIQAGSCICTAGWNGAHRIHKHVATRDDDAPARQVGRPAQHLRQLCRLGALALQVYHSNGCVESLVSLSQLLPMALNSKVGTDCHARHSRHFPGCWFLSSTLPDWLVHTKDGEKSASPLSWLQTDTYKSHIPARTRAHPTARDAATRRVADEPSRPDALNSGCCIAAITPRVASHARSFFPTKNCHEPITHITHCMARPIPPDVRFEGSPMPSNQGTGGVPPACAPPDVVMADVSYAASEPLPDVHIPACTPGRRPRRAHQTCWLDTRFADRDLPAGFAPRGRPRSPGPCMLPAGCAARGP